MAFGRWAFFEGKIVPLNEAKVSVTAPIFNYGIGVLEGIRAYWNPDQKQLWIVKLWDHLDRLFASAKALLIEFPYGRGTLAQAIYELLRKEGYQEDVYIRPLAYAKEGGIGVRLHGLKHDVAIFTAPLGNYVANEEATRTIITKWRKGRHPAIPFKAKVVGNYINAAQAKTEAHDAGSDEAIVLNEEGTVSEGSAANLFIVREGRLITPPETANILVGMTRDFVMTLARNELGIEVEESPILVDELLGADEVFLCGTGVQIAAVTQINDHPVGQRRMGLVTAALRKLYFSAVRGEMKKYIGVDYVLPVYTVQTPRQL